MKNALNPFEDRRKNRRKKIKIDVQLKVGINVKGSGYTQDISLDGVLIKSPEIFCYFKPELAHAFQDADVIMSFPEEGVTIKGKVIRIDASKEELAIRISRKSNENTWKMICG
jgi:hypothetical protein